MEHAHPLARNAIVTAGSADFEARVHACYAERAMLGFEGTHPPTFALGDVLQLELYGGRLESSVRGDARVIERVEGKGVRQYTLEFDTPLFDAGKPEENRDRRYWIRARAPVEEPVPIVVVPLTGGKPRTKLQRNGRLVDVSGGGLGILILEELEGALAGYEVVRVRFQPPRTSASVERECRIRSRALLDDGIRLGLQFAAEDASLTFEPMWDCGECGAKGMLESTHPRCCGCGRERTEGTELADWGDLVPRVDHRFTGSERVCRACGAGWSEAAEYCGLCGTALP